MKGRGQCRKDEVGSGKFAEYVRRDFLLCFPGQGIFVEVLIDKGPADRLEAAVRFVKVWRGKTAEPRGFCEWDGDVRRRAGRHGVVKEATNLGAARSKNGKEES